MGHYYSGMLDIMTDVTLVSIAFGTHVGLLEVDELSALCAEVSEADVKRRVAEFHDAFDVQPDCPAEELGRAARTSVALDAFVARHDLDAMAYYYMGSGIAGERRHHEFHHPGHLAADCAAHSRGRRVRSEKRHGHEDHGLLGAGGSFTEYYAIDFNDDLVLMGHDGPGHIAIAEGKTKVRPAEGLSRQSRPRTFSGDEREVRPGDAALGRRRSPTTRFKLLAAEGECVAGEILEIGNTNSRYRFPLGARGFVEAWNAQGPAHHCAVGVGHVAATLSKAAALMGIGFQQVC